MLYAYLTILTGNRAGTNFPLDPAREIGHRPGDGLPHFDSRSDLVARACGDLRGRTTSGRSATRRAATARASTVRRSTKRRLADGNTIRIGGTEFEFHESEEPPTAKGDDPQVMQTIVQDLPIAVQQSHEEALAGLPSAEQVKELMLLYQLCIKLMGSGDPNRVVEIALELLEEADRGGGGRLPGGERRGRPAAEAGDSAGGGEPRDAQPIAHGAGLAAGARGVDRQSGDRRTGKDTHSLGHFADGVCAPLGAADGRRRADDARRDPRLSAGGAVPAVGFRLHHLGGEPGGDRAGAGAGADVAADRLSAAGREVARLLGADRRVRRRCTT